MTDSRQSQPAESGAQARVETDDSALGPSRRTLLAAERTWLSWWRTGMAVAAVAVAVGGVLPRLVDSPRTVFTLLGAGYALLAVVVFIAAFRRQRQIAEALARNGDIGGDVGWIRALTILGGLLAAATLVVLLIES